MSVLMEFAIFPTDKGESKSEYVARVIKMLKESDVPHQFGPMGTTIEVESIEEGFKIIQKAYEILDQDCNRIYSTIKIDYRKNKGNRLKQKIKSVEEKLQG